MFNPLKKLSIRTRMILVAVATTALALLASSAIFVVNQLSASQDAMVSSARALARLSAVNVAAAVASNNKVAAREIATNLAKESDVLSVEIVLENGRHFALAYSSDPQFARLLERLMLFPMSGGGPTIDRTSLFQDDYIHVRQTITLEGKALGYLDLKVSDKRLSEQVLKQMGFAMVVFIVALWVAYLLASRLQRIISEPLLRLSHAMRRVSNDGDYSVRVDPASDEATGVLIDGFNLMLEQTQAREAALARAVDELKVANAKAQSASMAKTQFLATMSHEIRTPMNGVLGMAELLLATPLTVDQTQYARTITQSGRALLTIINDVLDYSKIESGKLELEHIEFDVSENLEEIAELMAGTASSKGLEIITRLGRSLPRHLIGDPGRLRQILLNLVGNAIKFTAQGEVVVSVDVIENDHKHAKLRFEVSDTGIGLDASAQSQIFDAFTQADSSTTRKFGGSGLGLSIARQLVQMMGGDIGVKSELGRGSMFWFTANFVHADRRQDEARPLRKMNGLRVLVVDDSAASRQALRSYLSAWDMTSGSAENAQDALGMLLTSAACRAPYDVALIDMNMPGISGTQLARLIRSEPSVAGVRIVLLTPTGTAVSAAQLQEWGVQTALPKPARQSQLFDSLANVSLSGLITAPAPAVSRARKHAVRVLVAEDNLVNQQVAVGMLEWLGCTAEVVGNGREALLAVQTHEYDLVLMDVHMPEMDGLEATREIRKWEQSSGLSGSLPIVALTANALSGDRELCLAAGMNDYVSKPISRQALSEAMGRQLGAPALSLTGLGRAASATESAPQAKPSSLVPFDPQVLAALPMVVDGSKSGYGDELLDLYLDESGKTLVAIGAAFGRGDTKTLLRLVHTLKSSSASVGAMALAEVAAQQETLLRAGELPAAGWLQAAKAEFDRFEGALASHRERRSRDELGVQ